jgi:hypothetical protein
LTALLRAHGRIAFSGDVVSAYKREQDYTEAFWSAVCASEPAWWGRGDKPECLYVDDVGQEPVCMSYGERTEVLDAFFCRVYRGWQDHGVLLHFTSNLTPAEMDARYGRRVTDRLREMCYCLELNGGSLRSESYASPTPAMVRMARRVAEEKAASEAPEAQ